MVLKAGAAAPSAAAQSRDRTAVFTGFLRDVCGGEPQEGDEALFLEILRELERKGGLSMRPLTWSSKRSARIWTGPRSTLKN